mmetsp:Transcript_13632/g.27765  ORF Transcript_13632/g.27765 Transcript_13632/m.27765 type:complete len:1117 (-) Transcript_13632:64-3414(-)
MTEDDVERISDGISVISRDEESFEVIVQQRDNAIPIIPGEETGGGEHRDKEKAISFSEKNDDGILPITPESTNFNASSSPNSTHEDHAETTAKPCGNSSDEIKIDAPIVFEDHPSLSARSDVILLEDRKIHVLGQPNFQFLVEHIISSTGAAAASSSSSFTANGLRSRNIILSNENNSSRDHRSSNPSGLGTNLGNHDPTPNDNVDKLAINSSTIITKLAKDSSPGLLFLRALQTLIATLMLGFIFVAAIQFLLYYILGLALVIGYQDIKFSDGIKIFSGLCSLPCFTVGLARASTLSWIFVKDCWNGLGLVKSVLVGGGVGNMIGHVGDGFEKYTKRVGKESVRKAVKSAVVVEWGAFLVFWGIPLLVLCFSLLSGTDRWWNVTASIWVVTVFVCSALFGIIVTYFEISVALELVCYLEQVEKSSPLKEKLKQLILTAKRHCLSSSNEESYFECVGNETVRHQTTHRTRSLYSRLTQILPESMFEQCDPPKLLFDINDDADSTPYNTSRRWDLSKVFCFDQNKRHYSVVVGPGSLQRNQMRSSIACAIIGAFLEFFVLISALVWFDVAALAIMALIFITMLCCVPTARRIVFLTRTFRLIQQWKELKMEKHEEWKYSGTLHRVRNVYWVSKPTNTLCWVAFGLEVVFLVLFPFITLCATDNAWIVLIFLLVCVLTVIKHYFDSTLVVRELGRKAIKESMVHRGFRALSSSSHDDDILVTGRPDWKSKLKHFLDISKHNSWRVLHRLDMVIGISGGKPQQIFSYIFIVFGIILLILLLKGVMTGTDTAGTYSGLTMVQNYTYYPAQDSFAYPTCQMTNGIKVSSASNTTLLDFTYLAILSYTNPAVTQQKLDEFFGPGVAENRDDLVQSFRAEAQQLNPITYLFITFPDRPGFGVISVKGTGHGWDLLADAQLWSAAVFFQILRFLLPFGEIWNSIFNNLIAAISEVESSSISEVSYYKQITEFISFLKSSTEYTDLVVTGHSLGGGTAIIAGAQSGIPAIGVSGPNAKLSRLSFDPPLTLEDIDKNTFNIIPQRDPVAMIDDPGLNYQNIRCTAPMNNLLACHGSTRSVCEIMYSCGNYNRPAICECIDDEHRYPSPLAPSLSEDFATACANAVA